MTKTVFIFLIFVAMGVSGCSRPPQEQKSSDLLSGQQTTQGSAQNLIAANASKRDGHLQEGIRYLRGGNLKAAIESFDEAIRLNPQDPAGYIILGQTYMRMQDYNRAIDSFSAALRVAPQQGEIYYFLALNHSLIGNKEQAKENVQKSLEIFRQQEDEEKFLRSLALLRDLARPEGQ
jgi:Tfp pilus assembly protein PilF